MNVQNPILETIEKAKEAAKNNTLPDKLISSDSHVTEPAHTYTKYIDPKFRDRAPTIKRTDDGGDSFVIDGIPGSVPCGVIAAAGKDPQDMKYGGTKFEELHKGGWDGKARVADQDRDGVAAEVIYPSVGMIICNHNDPDYKQACMWAYNRWLQEEFCAGAPGRLIGLGQTAVRSVKEAIADLEKFKEMGFRGVMLPGDPATAEDYDHPSFDPLWQASIDLNMPVSFHILTSRSDGGANTIEANVKDQGKPAAANTRPPRKSDRLLKSLQDLIGMFIFSRVLERNPKLKLVIVEADAGWAPHYAYRMDHAYKRHRFWVKIGELQKLPSEYFMENIYLTFQDDWVALRMTNMMNPRRLMWANDFPHSDSTWPWSRDLLLGQTTHLSEQEKNWILRDNCAEMYGIALN
jgi:predicted TIM-barrel fold metal-dependent hydrolase